MLDVSKHDDIHAAFETLSTFILNAKDSENKLSESTDTPVLVALINGQSASSFGPIELISTNELKRAYEVNALGAIDVVKKFLPLLRESKGRIINISSAAGLSPGPAVGSYAASKMALETLSDSLRIELSKWGISVCIIEPGSTDTTLWSRQATTLASHPSSSSHRRSITGPITLIRNDSESTITEASEDITGAYAPLIQSVQDMAKETRRFAKRKDADHGLGDPSTRAIVHAVTAKYPMSRYLCGLDTRAVALMRWAVPEKILDLGLQAMLGSREEIPMISVHDDVSDARRIIVDTAIVQEIKSPESNWKGHVRRHSRS
ncbi:hypothetical protein HK096_000348 [Nowakowskiella sp. JEL0078]|nr:hypothetical protein HK096_000348 [Nowakowskiella sp. JEL0078]